MSHFLKALLLVSCLLGNIGIYAKNIDRQSALHMANEFWAGAQESRASERLRPVDISRSDKLPCHIFTPESGTGFVIVADNDCLSPIIGYSFDESLTEIPDPLFALLKGLDKYIDTNGDINRRGPRKASGTEILWKTASWAQGHPYNRDCPEISGTRCVTGCVATGYGIVMQYYKWPLKGKGTLDAYTTPSNLSVPGRALGTPYNWSQMPLSGYAATDEGQLQIARLLADIGCAIHADYGVGTTGAGIDPSPIIEHFGYSKYMYTVNYDYSDKDPIKAKLWENRIVEEIKQHPFPMSLYPPSYDEGHFIVIDGLSADHNYVHANMGWGGSGDGFYTIETLMWNDSYQEIICNMVPDKDMSDVDIANLFVAYDEIICKPDPMTSDEFEVQKFGVFNRFASKFPDAKFSGVIRAAHVDRDHNIKEWCSDLLAFGNEYYHDYTDVAIKITQQRQFGDRVCFFYKLDGSDNWHIIDNNGQFSNEILLADEAEIKDSISLIYDREQQIANIVVDLDGVEITLTDDLGNPVDALTTGYRGNQATIDIKKLPDTPCYLSVKKGTDSVRIKVNVKDI